MVCSLLVEEIDFEHPWTMKYSKNELNQARANYCVSQAALAKDEKIKQFWDDLADEWLEMDAKARSNPFHT